MSSTPTAGGAVPKSGTHPAVVVGVIAVVVFAAAGAASYLGLIPGSGPRVPPTPVSTAMPAQQPGTLPDAALPRRSIVLPTIPHRGPGKPDRAALQHAIEEHG